MKRNFTAIAPVLFLIAVFSNSATAQLITNNTQTPQQLVQNVLLGPGVTATNITYTGDPAAIGFFNGVNTNIGIDSGIVMTTGSIFAPDGPQGPNSAGSAGVDNNMPGDTDLDNISSPTFNAAVLEFDFIPQADTVKFRYVFGSDEYPEFVNSSFNDVFAFFISGVTVTLPSTNIALIPSTSNPVSINNVNCQNNSPYYICNDPLNSTCAASYSCPTSQASTTIQYDGFTTALTAIAAVQCGETYHIKIAIADVGDGAFDSGVFLEAGSFSSEQVNITSEISYGGPNDSTLFEGCGQACLIFDRGQANLSNADTVLLTIGGSAVNGVDYTSIPDTLIFQPGEDSIAICIQATADGSPEGLENLTITAIQTGICSQSQPVTLEIFIGDFAPLTVSANANSPICPGGNAILTTSASGGAEPYTFSWSNNLGSDTVISVSPTSTTTYTVTVTDACSTGQETATVTVTVLAPLQFSVPDQVICEGNNVVLSPSVSGGNTPFYYSWQTLSGPDTLTVNNDGTASLTPTASGTYQLTIIDNCNTSVSDQFTIELETACEIFIPNVFTPNGDETNDYFVVRNLEKYPNSQLLVYNRWGNKVFESSSYQNDWNGNGAADGVYYYVLNVSDGKNYRGFVTLLR